jgi:hypothetical protein
MVSKDQAIGGAILSVCILVATAYTVAMVKPIWVWTQLSGILGGPVMSYFYAPDQFRLWLVIVPVFIAFIAILVIGAWIGWTMATTPPPKPIEEITTEIEDKKGKATVSAEENNK